MFHVKREENVQACKAVEVKRFHVKRDDTGVAASDTLFHVKQAEAVPINLLLAGGRAPSNEWLQELKKLSHIAAVYCADKGASYALMAGLSPALVVGDCDSASEQVYKQAQSLGARLDVHPPAKDDTDLQLLLSQLPHGNLVATGIWGGRFDHLFSNVYSLLSFKEQRYCQVVLADDKEMMVLLTANEGVELSFSTPAKVHAISLLPLGAQSCVSIAGVRWPLKQAELTQYRSYAISNELVGQSISCSCHSGKLGLYLHWQVN
ncbi:MAG: thiamine diphosphokinase [Phascolarctobacterium sp.]